MRANSRYLILLWLACLLACTTINLFYFPHATIFPDEQRFVASAIRLAATGEFWVGRDRAWEMPGTAIFFAPAVKLFGAEAAVLPIRIAQSILLVVQSALIGLTAQRLFGKCIPALVAASLMAFYPFLLFYQGLLLSETLFNTLLLAAIAALYWWRDRGFLFDKAFAVTCLCFAAATWTKPTLTILPPLLMAAAAWAAGTNWRRALVVLLAASCLYSAFLSPWWVRNFTLFGTFVPFTTGSAQNLYLGNNAQPDVVTKIHALPDELARQRAFSKVTIDYIKDNPTAFVAAAARKFMRFWNVVPNAREFNSGLYSLISAASFGPILLLALIGAIRRWRQWRALAPLYLIVGNFTAVHIITVASLRYRLPIEPILILLAAEPLAALIERLFPGAMRTAR